MKKTPFFLLLSLLITSLLYSQSVSTPSQEINKGEAWHYARKIVDTMASESMHGRGYVNDGDKIAANYIRTEFQKYGLKSFTDDYYQKFSFAVNTFPGEVYLYDHGGFFEDYPNDVKYTYTPSPNCPTIKGKFKVLKIDTFNLKNEIDFKKITLKKHKRVFLLIDTLGIKNNSIKNYFELLLKTTPKGVKGFLVYKNIYDNSWVYKNPFGPWSISQEVAKTPIIKLMKRQNFEVEKISLSIESKFIPNYKSQNVISYVQGSIYPDSFIIFSAHYDHLGQMGKDVYFPGANDNASGCAMLLNLAKHYSKPENKPKCSIAFIAFGAEEVGLIGSKYYTEHPLFPLKNIKFLLNMDIMGTGEEGITVVNGSVFKPEFEKLKQINTDNNFIKDVKIRGKAANSDHYFFSENGVKAFFIYTMGGIKAYHDIYDRAETLPLNEFEDLFKMIIKFGDYLSNE